MAGEISIDVGLELGNLEKNLNTLKTKLGDTGTISKSVDADFFRLGKSAKTFGLAAAVGIGAALGGILAVAKQSPFVAGSLAKIEIEFFKLSNTVGKQTKPAFDKFAEIISEVNNFLKENPDFLNKMTDALITLGDTAINVLQADWFSDLVTEGTKVLALINSIAEVINGLANSRFGKFFGDVVSSSINNSVVSNTRPQDLSSIAGSSIRTAVGGFSTFGTFLQFQKLINLAIQSYQGSRATEDLKYNL